MTAAARSKQLAVALAAAALSNQLAVAAAALSNNWQWQ